MILVHGDKRLAELHLGRNYKGERHMTIRQGDAVLSVPVESLPALADLFIEFFEIVDGRVDATRPNAT